MVLAPHIIEKLKRIIRLPQGMVIVTGPAGSGKSTTLYTILQELNEPTRNIVTLEDPIEKKIPGIAQGALQPKVGFTFAEGLRAILRQDPNVIMLGEVRDAETAENAMSAALTGHMLLTTLHTTSALGVVSRLLDMGLEPFLVSSAITAVFAQRLVRKACQTCRVQRPPTPAETAQAEDMSRRAGFQFAPELLPQSVEIKGCPECRMSGYAGRVLVFELVELSTSLRQEILTKASIDDMRRIALQEGADFLLVDGFRKVNEGLTDMTELTRVLGFGD
jgi:type II secretory ATPase GspE/PulE/Tfp pilus assembly ATPase PilB-like protein